ncbi:response regulator transcription factor [Amycolatopsis magusensis]|uniref:Two-component system response regulator DesR n=1 Tax=Amycolatopsis magusensis TaxID=882444 RepID=A0ABS4PLV2_9PSEU|nr:response regulator transcription factor [Amycolatopsis magusensis]MBP2180397.1 two-component system response regulator DesR [Amycolatopsis magusensis]MDI5980204.1 response regulator transcription factor [Amycolatopsis magusensis]
MIRVVLADDEQLTRQAIESLLNLEPDLTVVAGVPDGAAALEAVAEHRPDVLVVDHEMPVLDGLAVLERVARTYPGVRSVMLTRHARPGVLRQALSSGAKGFLAKTAPASLLAEVIRRVHAGLRYVDPEFAADAIAEVDCPLTERELDVLRLVDDTTTATEIARAMHLSAGTVRNYTSSAMTKLGARSRGQAARIARDHGWI